MARLLFFILLILHVPLRGTSFAESMPSTTMAASASATAVIPANRVMLGVYDPHSAWSHEQQIGIDHIFVFWQALDRNWFELRLSQSRSQGRMVMVTIEPFTKAANWRDGGDRLFADIIAGRFAREIDNVCRGLASINASVLVRWGHEMEDPTARYPWARRDSEGYKAAYRHFARECRHLAPKARFVWSPKGERNLANYYPGNQYVDFVGVSLWGLQKYDVAYHGGQRDFPETFREKYSRVAAFGKPVVIAELGVSGDNTYRERWFNSLFGTISQGSIFRQLSAVVYFNDKEPHHWPLGLGSPDWRAPANMFSPHRWTARTQQALVR